MVIKHHKCVINFTCVFDIRRVPISHPDVPTVRLAIYVELPKCVAVITFALPFFLRRTKACGLGSYECLLTKIQFWSVSLPFLCWSRRQKAEPLRFFCLMSDLNSPINFPYILSFLISFELRINSQNRRGGKTDVHYVHDTGKLSFIHQLFWRY